VSETTDEEGFAPIYDEAVAAFEDQGYTGGGR
jgi:hypothetical protein